jgi:hypothetical protein
MMSTANNVIIKNSGRIIHDGNSGIKSIDVEI